MEQPYVGFLMFETAFLEKSECRIIVFRCMESTFRN
jgi:hypothetical protein